MTMEQPLPDPLPSADDAPVNTAQPLDDLSAASAEMEAPAAPAHSSEASGVAQPKPTLAEEILRRPARAQPAAAAEEDTLNVSSLQAGSQIEIQDFIRVLNTYIRTIPQVYVDHISVSGDMTMAGRGSGEIYPPPQRDSADVLPAEIAKVRSVFHKPAAYPQALRLLREQHCVALRGKTGAGKRCAAIRLLAELLGDSADIAIRELSADSDLAQDIQALAVKPGHAFLVDDLLASRGKALTPLAARTMLDTLRRRDCYLVICARPDVSMPRDLAVVGWEAPPVAPTVLVETHLAYYDSFSPEQISEALAHQDIAAVLQSGLTPALADRLAEQLATALRSGRPLEDAVRGFVAVAEDDVRGWFDAAGEDLNLRAMRMALAVFSGARFDLVYAAAKNLEARWPQPEADDEEPKKPPPSIFASKQSDLLAGARSVRRPMATSYSDRTMVEVVELIDPNYSPALLKYLWEHPALRGSLLAWLMHYAVDGRSPQEMRLRAAAAVGALAGIDFDSIQARTLRPWAVGETSNNDERRRRYAALSNALGMLIWNDECAGTVRDLLHAWLEEGNESARWAAARVYAQVGLRYPREAMNQWRRILESKGKIELRLTESFGFVIPHPLHLSVVDAILSLFIRATQMPHRLRPVYEQALEGLAAWVEADAVDANAKQVGLPLFVALTAIRLPPETGEGEPEQWPPAMLTIVGTQPDSAYRRILASLFRRAVVAPNLQHQTVAALRSWAEAAENDPWLEETLAAVLAEWLALPGASQRERNLLHMHLSRWARHPKQPLLVAQRLIVSLKLM
jgi:hypothetical protein